MSRVRCAPRAGARARAPPAPRPQRPALQPGRAARPRRAAPRALFGLPAPPNPFGPPPRVSFEARTRNVMGEFPCEGRGGDGGLAAYLADTDRVVAALFPDAGRMQKLADGSYRTFLLERDFLLVRVQPVVDLRLEPSVDAAGVGSLRMECCGWELRGLDQAFMPKAFDMVIDGAVRSEAARTRGARTMSGEVALRVECDVPEPLRLTPTEIFEATGQAFLQSILDAMKAQANASLLNDFKRYQAERARETVRVGAADN